MKARSPLVRYRAAVDLLGWPPDGAEAAALWKRRYDDPDLGALAAAQTPDGLWHAKSAFYGRRLSLYVPKYRASVWQLPVLAGLGVDLTEPVAARAAEALLARRTKDGFFDLGPGGPFVAGNAVAVNSLAALGVEDAALAAPRAWLLSLQRRDGGWADAFDVEGEEAPSTIGATTEVVLALAGESGSGGVAVGEGRKYLLSNLFTDYNGRFPRSRRRWRRLSWPQYQFDALKVVSALAAVGASRFEIAALAQAVRALQTRRGFWRQQVPLGEPCWFAPVRAGRASRWLTFHATRFLLWFYEARGEERDCYVNVY